MTRITVAILKTIGIIMAAVGVVAAAIVTMVVGLVLWAAPFVAVIVLTLLALRWFDLLPW